MFRQLSFCIILLLSYLAGVSVVFADVGDEFRTMNGWQNSLKNPLWGNADTSFLRIAPVGYGDGIDSPSGSDRPSARAVSNAVGVQTESIPNDRQLSNMVWQWGQFIDHDITLTPATNPPEPFMISVPAGDPSFDPNWTGTQVIPLMRSEYDHATGHGTSIPRAQKNMLTSFVDASMIYGSDDAYAALLRTFNGGKLLMSEQGFLPDGSDGLPLAGDVRAGEQPGLTALHTLFVREHNRLADEIAAKNPGMSDEEIYQRARRIVGAEIQVITYEEFLPALLGRGGLRRSRGYDSSVNPGIGNEFATAAFRFGHSAIPSLLLRLNSDWQEIPEGHLNLRDGFFQPHRFYESGLDPLLRGLMAGSMEEIDTHVVDELRNFLFGAPGAGGMDLLALNIQRGRDHGLPSYNTVRMAFDLSPVSDFDDITRNRDMQHKLEDLYGDVDSIDLFVGMLAEDHVRGSSVGPLIEAILVDQFIRLRDGGRFFYQWGLQREELFDVRRTSLSDVISRNTDIDDVSHDVFHIPPRSILGYLQNRLRKR